MAFLPVQHRAGLALALHRRFGKAERFDGRGVEVELVARALPNHDGPRGADRSQASCGRACRARADW